MGSDDPQARESELGLPFNREAERATLGAMMLDGRKVWEILDVVSPADFHDPQNEAICEAIKHLAVRRVAIDPITVEEELAGMGEKLPSGPAYLYELTSSALAAASGVYHAEIVATNGAKRRLMDAAKQITALAASPSSGSMTDTLEQARSLLDNLTVRDTQEAFFVRDEIDETIASLAEEPELTQTPWAGIDEFIGGLRPGAMYVIGARPGAGKTAMAMNLALPLAQTGVVGFASLEMSRRELHKRIIAQIGEVHVAHLVNNALDDDDWNRVRGVGAAVRDSQLALLDKPGMTIGDVRSWVRSLSRKGTLAAAVVDYVQLMQSADPTRSRQQVVGEFSRAMKLIAKEFHIPVIVLSQLNRKSEDRIDKKPSISDLRESGDLEQDADVVLLLSRDDRDPEREGEVLVQIAKNRHGSTGEVSLAWLGHYSKMVGMRFDDGPPPPDYL